MAKCVRVGWGSLHLGELIHIDAGCCGCLEIITVADTVADTAAAAVDEPTQMSLFHGGGAKLTLAAGQRRRARADGTMTMRYGCALAQI